jgi:hypothetical protein
MPESPKRSKPAPRGRIPTLRDVFRMADVSKATVSRVLDGHPKVKARTRERIQHVIETLRYTPSAVARNLSRRKTDTIGLRDDALGVGVAVIDDVIGFMEQGAHGRPAAHWRANLGRRAECLRLGVKSSPKSVSGHGIVAADVAHDFLKIAFGPER